MGLIETVHLCQEYKGCDILKGITLSIERGEIFALIGPTGAGKTTLLRLLDLLDMPVSGKVYFDGVDVTCSRQHRLKVRRRMSFVQQKPVVFNMSVFDNVACGLEWRHVRSDNIRQKVEHILDMVGMVEYGKRNARTLSGGETQRVAVARALVTDPELLLLDEPTANLDPISTSKIEEVLTYVIRQRQTTMVMATHDMSQGQRLAGRIGVLAGGEILQVGSPGEIFTLPRNKQVAEFVGVDNILYGTVVEKDGSLVALSINEGSHAIQAISDSELGEPVYALVRPEDVILTTVKMPSSARNSFMGNIIKMTPLGPLVRIELDCGFPLLGLITKRSAEELGLVTGKTVHASFKASAVRTIKRWR